jgi:hypothetical protein
MQEGLHVRQPVGCELPGRKFQIIAAASALVMALPLLAPSLFSGAGSTFYFVIP